MIRKIPWKAQGGNPSDLLIQQRFRIIIIFIILLSVYLRIII